MIAVQSRVPTSPVEVENTGKINLCAAACLAYAGLQVAFSEQEAKLFETELMRTRSSSVIEEAFETFGWGRDLCGVILQFNDNLSPELRKARVLQLFQNPGSVDLSNSNPRT